MTKYLFFALIFAIFVLLVFIFLPLISNFGKPKPMSTPPPVLTAPSASPTFIPGSSALPSGIPSADQIQLQAKADQDFAEKIKQRDALYPWLDKLPIQTSNYFAYFDVDQKQFIATLFPSSASTISIDEQVNGFKSEITTKLQNLIPDYTQYNIQWNIKPE